MSALRYPPNRAMCSTCIFREDGKAAPLMPGRLDEIKAYLLLGTTHLCHHPRPAGERNKRACRGGRDFQLTCWHRMGILPEPTDAALAAEMKAKGP